MQKFFDAAAGILGTFYPALTGGQLKKILDKEFAEGKTGAPEPDKLLSGRDAAARLGVSPMTVRRLSDRGLIRKIRIQVNKSSWTMHRGNKTWVMETGRVRYFESDINQLIKTGTN